MKLCYGTNQTALGNSHRPILQTSVTTAGDVSPRSKRVAKHRERRWMSVLTVLMLTLTGASGQSSLAAEPSGAESPSMTQAMTAGTTRQVDINSADAAQLSETLNGVGLSRAEAIVRYREQFGPFESVEELSEVKGIGDSTVERNRARIRLK